MKLVDIHSILKPIIEQAGTITVSSYDDLGSGNYQINSTDTKYAHPPKSLNINGNTYKITSYVQNESLTVIGDVLPTGDITLSVPKYWHGTVISTNNERADIPDQSSETPFVYFAETFTEDYGSIDNGFVDIPIQLFFLDESRYDQYETEGFYSDIIKPMRSMCEDVINRMYKNFRIMNVDDIRITNTTKFGRFLDSKGYETSIFNEELTGVELRCTLRVKQKAC